MVLLIVHYHLRPGGVRRVIEIAAPILLRQIRPPITEIWVLTGEAPDPAWQDHFRTELIPARIRLLVEPALGYLSEQRRTARVIRQRIRRFLDLVRARLEDRPAAIWAHNLGLARNPLLLPELTRFADRARVPLVAHHHDWWFDNRWQRWPELQRSGFRSLRRAAELVFPPSLWMRHATINRADFGPLAADATRPIQWLPNPVMPGPGVGSGRTVAARAWLTRVLDHEGPVWLVPCRFLRRKNIAEALLLTRWLKPEAMLVTTGAPSSREEEPCAGALCQAAHRERWPLRLGVLASPGAGAPSVSEIMAASQAILLTSIQEGFGLPYLEAVAARRPLLARSLPNIAPDLACFGFRFPQLYEDILIDPALFDTAAERHRQAARFEAWRRRLPRKARRHARLPTWLDQPSDRSNPIAFSRLTLAGQLEVLSVPADSSWPRAVRLNPWLRRWRHRARADALQQSPWPAKARQWLGSAGYARRFQQLLQPVSPAAVPASEPQSILRAFLESRLASANLYPLLWTTEP